MARTRAEVISEMVDSGLFSDDEIRSAIKPKKATPPTSKDYTDPTALIKQAAPSNLLSMLGVGSANAPDATRLGAAMLPGGDPNEMVEGFSGLMRNPRQIPAALSRMGFTQNGAALTPEEELPSMAGALAGVAIETAAMPKMGAPKVKANGPFTAGIADPSTVAPGALKKAQQALGAAKTSARATDPSAARFRRLLGNKSGFTKLAEEGKSLVDEGLGEAMDATELLAYKEALGKSQALGGTLSGDYAAAVAKINQIISAKFPEMAQAISKTATNYAAAGADSASIPWLTLAIDPRVGLTKMATLPAVRNAAGAAVGMGFNNSSKLIPAINASLGFRRTREQSR